MEHFQQTSYNMTETFSSNTVLKRYCPDIDKMNEILKVKNLYNYIERDSF
jgi:hypothetical protein